MPRHRSAIGAPGSAGLDQPVHVTAMRLVARRVNRDGVSVAVDPTWLEARTTTPFEHGPQQRRTRPPCHERTDTLVPHDDRAKLTAAMDRYADGDEAAFGDVYDHLAPRVYGFFVRQTGDAARAEDLVQQTLLQMHAARLADVRGSDVVPWAFCIGRRLLVDGRRRTKKPLLFDTAGQDATALDARVERFSVPDGTALTRERAARAEEELEKMRASHREAYTARPAERPLDRAGRGGARHDGDGDRAARVRGAANRARARRRRSVTTPPVHLRERVLAATAASPSRTRRDGLRLAWLATAAFAWRPRWRAVTWSRSRASDVAASRSR